MGSYTPDEMLVVLGFKITIDNAGSGEDTDTMWESCAGGSLNIECADASTGTSQTHVTTPGHKYVDTITLRGPLTPGRKAMCDWINSTVQGKVDQQYRTVVLKEIMKDGSEGKNFEYTDCFPTRYVFPAFSASGTGNLYEEVSFKPIRLTLT